MVDVNLLLYATNRDLPQHERARDWWHSALSGAVPMVLTWQVLAGFLRLSTRVGIFARPLTVAEALETVDGWLSHPNTVVVGPGVRHWQILQELIEAAGTGGNVVPHAQLAALAIEHDLTLYSADRDFARFKGLRWVNPLA